MCFTQMHVLVHAQNLQHFHVCVTWNMERERMSGYSWEAVKAEGGFREGNEGIDRYKRNTQHSQVNLQWVHS